MNRINPRPIGSIAVLSLAAAASPAVAAPTLVYDFGADAGKTSTADFASVVSRNVLVPDDLLTVSDEPDGIALRLADASIGVVYDVELTPANSPDLSTINPSTDTIAVDVVLEPGHNLHIFTVSFESPLNGAWSRFFLDTFDLPPGAHRLVAESFAESQVPGVNTRAFDPHTDPLERMTLSLLALGVPTPLATAAIQIDRVAFVPEPAAAGLVIIGAISLAHRTRHD